MNSSQLAGILRAVIPALAAYLAAKGAFFDTDTWNIILASLATAGVAAWSAKVHTDSSAVIAAAAVQGATVKIDATASPAVKAVAADPTVPAVQMVAPAPVVQATRPAA
jgi:hypothetical protein